MKNLIASASFFVICTPSEDQDIIIKEFPKPAFGSWGGIAPKMKEAGVTFGESNPLSKLGYHKANNLKLDFDHDEGTELMVDCKQYTSDWFIRLSIIFAFFRVIRLGHKMNQSKVISN